MSSIDQLQDSARTILGMAGWELGPQCCAAATTNGVLSLALCIIGCASASFSAAGIGYTTIALAGGMFASVLAIGNLKARKIEILLSAFMAAAFITFGALGATSILTANQIGWGILGTYLVGMIGGCGIGAKKALDIL